jgi:peptidoglycan hydrolase-like protein with peptidoglycan-binding domain
VKDANGHWIGYGLGDTGAQVTEIQHRLIHAYPKNSQAVTLGVTESGTFDTATEQAVKNFQQTVGLPVTGIANYATQVRMGAVVPAPAPAPLVPTKPTFITVNGTGSPGPFDWGFAGAVGAALDPSVWYWQPIAYPAATFPMGPSVQAGRAEVVRQIQMRPIGTPLGLSGYSQGSLVTDFVWRDDILNPNGVLHNRVNDVKAIVNFGDPMRAPGICNGNVQAGFPIPAPVDGVPSGGIAGPADLTADQTPDFLMSCNNDGDLYGAAPVGNAAGSDETLMFNLIQNASVNNLLAIALSVIPLLNPAQDIAELIASLPTLILALIPGASGMLSLPTNPSNAQIVGFLEALINGGMFVLSGFGPHGDYQKMVPAMTDYVMAAGRAAA